MAIVISDPETARGTAAAVLYEKRKAAVVDEREARTLAIASEALAAAKEANCIAADDLSIARASARWAMYAAIIATVAAVIAAKDHLLAMLFGSL